MTAPVEAALGSKLDRLILAARARGPAWLVAQSLFTVLTLALIAGIALPALRWAVFQADWRAVAANLRLLMVGTFPQDSLWRPVLVLMLTTALLGRHAFASDTARSVARPAALVLLALLGMPLLAPLVGAIGPTALDELFAAFGGATRTIALALAALALGFLSGQLWRPRRRSLRLAWLLLPPLAVLILGPLSPPSVLEQFLGWLTGGTPSLSPVQSDRWGGLLLTLVLAVVSIGVSFVLGVLLALGRRSSLPLVKVLSVVYIETIRGVPLVTVLSAALLLAPLVLPEGRLEGLVIRAMVGLILFTAAYIAEDVRGGLNAIGRGQYDAALALGLGVTGTYRLVVLPQALRVVVPSLVGQFISLFKDTALVGLLGLNELLGMALAIVGQPEWIGRYRESLVFIALIYFAFCYSMARASSRLEVKESRESA